MIGLKCIDDQFEIEFSIIENGSGNFKGIIDEISQTQAPSYVFSPPRRILRVNPRLLLSTSMIIRSPGGTTYMMGEHGDSETSEGVVFKSFRLFETHTRFPVERRTQVVDAFTGLKKDSVQTQVTTIWGAYEPLPEVFDREIRVPTETARFITNYPLQRQDIIEGKSVFRVDKQLGLYIATLT